MMQKRPNIVSKTSEKNSLPFMYGYETQMEWRKSILNAEVEMREMG
jgi:hypothetical protein